MLEIREQQCKLCVYVKGVMCLCKRNLYFSSNIDFDVGIYLSENIGVFLKLLGNSFIFYKIFRWYWTRGK